MSGAAIRFPATRPYAAPASTTDDVRALGEEVSRLRRQLDELVRVLPVLRLVKLTIPGDNLPLLIDLPGLPRVDGAVFVRACEHGKPETPIDAGSLSWHPSTNPKRPGIAINSVGSDITAGVVYDFTILLISEGG